MKPISKSKRQLAQLLIEAGVKTFPEGADWVAQDGDDGRIFFYEGKPSRKKGSDFWGAGSLVHTQREAPFGAVIPNWHQTVLSRAEFDQIFASHISVGDIVDVKTSITTVKPENFGSPLPQSPTLDQLLQDYRNAADFAARNQAEADEAAKMRDERWQAVQARAGEMGVSISVDAEMRGSGPVITDWRDLRVGDVVLVTGCNQNPGWNRLAGVELDVVETGDSLEDLYFKPKDGERWCCSDNTRWRFIRRP